MQSVILAGGASTRLPNKPILPISNDRIAIESAMGFACQVSPKMPIVVTSENSIVATLLTLRGWRFKQAIQSVPAGVTDAIATAVPNLDDDMLVLFCDNIYDDMSMPETYGVSVVMSNNAQLDCWENGKWHNRKPGELYRIAGYYFLSKVQAQSVVSSMTCIEFLNMIGAQPIIHTRRWADIGTINSYKEYLQCFSPAQFHMRRHWHPCMPESTGLSAQ